MDYWCILFLNEYDHSPSIRNAEHLPKQLRHSMHQFSVNNGFWTGGCVCQIITQGTILSPALLISGYPSYRYRSVFFWAALLSFWFSTRRINSTSFYSSIKRSKRSEFSSEDTTAAMYFLDEREWISSLRRSSCLILSLHSFKGTERLFWRHKRRGKMREMIHSTARGAP